MRIRNATLADSALILDWRNSDTARLNSFSNHIISKSEHENWINSALSDSRYFIYLIYQDSENIGVVTFYQENGICFNVSININPLYRGNGLAKKVLLLAESRFANTHSENLKTMIFILEAKILIKNIVSRRLFESSFYKIVKNEKDRIILRKELTLIKKT